MFCIILIWLKKCNKQNLTLYMYGEFFLKFPMIYTVTQQGFSSNRYFLITQLLRVLYDVQIFRYYLVIISSFFIVFHLYCICLCFSCVCMLFLNVLYHIIWFLGFACHLFKIYNVKMYDVSIYFELNIFGSILLEVSCFIM